MQINKRALGGRYEDIAAAFLSQKGYRILERNYHTRLGEIDIIATEGNYLCFVEVKYRSNLGFGYPSEAVDKRKQKKIIESALIYIKSKCLLGQAYRFDVVEIIGHQIRVIRNSFGEN